MAGLKYIYDVLTGAVERVKKIRDYAFVHFAQREDAIAAMNALNGKVINLSWLQHSNFIPYNVAHFDQMTQWVIKNFNPSGD